MPVDRRSDSKLEDYASSLISKLLDRKHEAC